MLTVERCHKHLRMLNAVADFMLESRTFISANGVVARSAKFTKLILMDAGSELLLGRAESVSDRIIQSPGCEGVQEWVFPILDQQGVITKRAIRLPRPVLCSKYISELPLGRFRAGTCWAAPLEAHFGSYLLLVSSYCALPFPVRARCEEILNGFVSIMTRATPYLEALVDSLKQGAEDLYWEWHLVRGILGEPDSAASVPPLNPPAEAPPRPTSVTPSVCTVTAPSEMGAEAQEPSTVTDRGETVGTGGEETGQAGVRNSIPDSRANKWYYERPEDVPPTFYKDEHIAGTKRELAVALGARSPNDYTVENNAKKERVAVVRFVGQKWVVYCRSKDLWKLAQERLAKFTESEARAKEAGPKKPRKT